MLRENVAIPQRFLLCFLFFILLHTRPQTILGSDYSGLKGSGRSLISEGGEPSSQIEGTMFLREGSKFHCFPSPLALLLLTLGPDFWHSHGKYSAECVMKPSFLLEGQNREVVGNQKIAGKPLKAAYGLLSWLPSFACVSLILNSIRKCWARNYGLEHPPIPKLDTMWVSYETVNWTEIGNTTHRRHVRTWSMNPTGSVTGLKKTQNSTNILSGT